MAQVPHCIRSAGVLCVLCLQRRSAPGRKQQRGAILDAAYEACLMLKDAGIPVNDANNTDNFQPGTSARRKMEAMVFTMTKHRWADCAFRITPCTQCPK